ncbi:serine hydrolase domain-containing protein [uncultured Jatrophihabitans sp.]|uniref:serine hydrolase domain-containing protein n=1 Tax=uncultured Jatrophihabitans sp. TaxID=1610747 RepID=UPI0035CA0415
MTGSSDSFANALAQLDDWPVETVAAAVVGPAGVLATHGSIDTQVPLASVTKPLAALAVLVAVEEEAVTLDDPAEENLLPGATLRHLLAHASGVAPERPLRSFGPAQRRVYSNVGIEFAARLVERATGMPFADYLAGAVLDPLGMRGTYLDGSPARDAVSRASDLARVLAELLTSTGLLAPETRADLATVQYPGLRGVLPGYGGQPHNDWGLGFEIRADKSPHWTGATNSPRTFGHFGQSGTMLWLDPDASLGLVALTDRAFGEWAIEAWPRLSDAVLAAAR